MQYHGMFEENCCDVIIMAILVRLCRKHIKSGLKQTLTSCKSLINTDTRPVSYCHYSITNIPPTL